MQRLLTALLIFAGGALFADDKKEFEKLAGKWQPTEMKTADNKVPEDQLKNTILIIDGDKYMVIVSGSKDSGTLKLDTKAKPKTMDVVGTEGPNKGKTMPAIYELDGDNLKICYALRGAQRPADFKATGEKILLITYKRVKEDKKK